MSVDDFDLDDLAGMDPVEIREIIEELLAENARLRARADRWRDSRDDMARMLRESMITHRAQWNMMGTQVEEMRAGTLTMERRQELADEYLGALTPEMRKRYAA